MKKKCFIMKRGLPTMMRMMMMMCCSRLSLLPHSDDVLCIVSTRLPVASLSPFFFGLHTFFRRDYRTRLTVESKHQIESTLRTHVG